MYFVLLFLECQHRCEHLWRITISMDNKDITFEINNSMSHFLMKIIMDPLRSLCNPFYSLSNLLFYWVAASADTSHSLIASGWSLINIPLFATCENLCNCTLDTRILNLLLCLPTGSCRSAASDALPAFRGNRRNLPVLVWRNGCTTRHPVQLLLLLKSCYCQHVLSRSKNINCSTSRVGCLRTSKPHAKVEDNFLINFWSPAIHVATWDS
jgi:hypothetical protein